MNHLVSLLKHYVLSFVFLSSALLCANTRPELQYFFLAKMFLENLNLLADSDKLDEAEIVQLKQLHKNIWEYTSRRQTGSGWTAAEKIATELSLDALSTKWLRYSLYKITTNTKGEQEIVQELARKALMIHHYSKIDRARTLFDFFKANFPKGPKTLRNRWNTAQNEKLTQPQFYLELRAARAYLELIWWQTEFADGISYAEHAIELRQSGKRIGEIANIIKVDAILVYDFLLDQNMVDAFPKHIEHHTLLQEVNSYFSTTKRTSLPILTTQGWSNPATPHLFASLCDLCLGIRNLEFLKRGLPNAVKLLDDAIPMSTDSAEVLDLQPLTSNPKWKSIFHIPGLKATAFRKPKTPVVKHTERVIKVSLPSSNPYLEKATDRIVKQLIIEYLRANTSTKEDSESLYAFLDEGFNSNKAPFQARFKGTLEQFVTELFSYLLRLSKKKDPSKEETNILNQKFNILLDIDAKVLAKLNWEDRELNSILKIASAHIRQEILQLWLARVRLGKPVDDHENHHSLKNIALALFEFDSTEKIMQRYIPELNGLPLRNRPAMITIQQIFGEHDFATKQAWHRFRIFDSQKSATDMLYFSINEIVQTSLRERTSVDPMLLQIAQKHGLEERFKKTLRPRKFSYPPNTCIQAVCQSCANLVANTFPAAINK
jgi:hypothetical protein